ncbi:type II secretion system protein GspL [Gallaecimonas sp. GXIMD4217]|uniref:type II secretion system protein GspL n=1 Tax=Gallaecimonas sp. GXIMD4217 TaxID=3131927 RepID=UPI00311AE477
MSQTLVLRLGMNAEDPIHWLIRSAREEEILSSGRLAGASELAQLADKAGDAKVLVLVPGQALGCHVLPAQGKGRQFLKAVPFMLEEQLADDVEHLHFTLIPQGEQVHALVCGHGHMQAWLGWLAETGLKPFRMLPDMLALPHFEDSWSALALDGELLVRTGPYQGLAGEAELVNLAIQSLTVDSQDIQPVNAYSELRLPANCTLNHLGAELPLAVLAKGAEASRLNLLHGPYGVKQEGQGQLKAWWPLAAACAALLVVAVAGKAVSLYQLKQQEAALQAQIETDFKRLFPGTRRIVNVRSQMRQKLKALGGASSEPVFLAMLADLAPALKAVPGMRPDSLRFDDRRGELRLMLVGKDYAAFETLKGKLSDAYEVEAGGQSAVEGGVSGALVLRSR